MLKKLFSNKYAVAIWILIGVYIIYFSYFTIIRYQTLYASYFDLGIMHQTVYNTYKGLATGDWSRILELTNPYGPEQIKRMAIHNDILLAFIAPFYFIHSGPETLLVIQTVVMALGAWGIFKIAQVVFKKNNHKDFLSFIFAFSYLLYPAIERTNIYEFHAVALTTTFIILMFYFWLVKRYKLSFLFIIISLLSKEQVGLTTAFFGLYIICKKIKGKEFYFPLAVILTSLIWFFVSVSAIIPYFRGGNHFALSYYGDFGDSPTHILIGIFRNPQSLVKYIFHIDTFRYFLFLLGPLSFLSLFSLPTLAIALPEFGINLLSNSWSMRNIIFHYTAVIQPIVFISSIYGAAWLINRFKFRRTVWIGIFILTTSLIFTYFKGPLPYSREQEVHPFIYPQKEAKVVATWAMILKDENLKISTTGQLAPHFTSRRYFYIFSNNYPLADYIVLRTGEIYNYPEKDVLIPIYQKLIKDKRFEKIYGDGSLEVYKKIKK